MLPMLARGLCVSIALVGVADPFPKYAVEPGAVIQRVYTGSTKLESEPARMFADGVEVDMKGKGERRMRIDETRSSSVTDTIRAVEGGRPTKFTRKYGDCRSSGTETTIATPPEGKEVSRAATIEKVSGLTGKTVEFTWSDSADAYQAKSEAELDEETLGGLVAEMEWLELLEGGPREKGVPFDVDGKLLARVWKGLGDLTQHVEGKAPDPLAKSVLLQFVQSLDGKAKAIWQGSREVEGRACSVFELTGRLTTNASAELGPDTQSFELEFDYEGEILWDLTAGRVAGYALEADVHSVHTTKRSVESPDGTVELRQVYDLKGTSKYTLAVTNG